MGYFRLLTVLIFTTLTIKSYSQEQSDTLRPASMVIDSLKTAGYILNEEQQLHPIELSPDQAVEYLRYKTCFSNWKDSNNPLRRALQQLLRQAGNPPFDSTAVYLKKYPYDSLALSLDNSYPFQSDSIKVAVNSILSNLEKRDSSLIYFEGTGSSVIPVWINNGSDKAIRYWLKNDMSDSVTVWIANPGHNRIGLYLENGIIFRRPSRASSGVDARVNVTLVDKSRLLEINKIMVKPKYWKLRSEASFVLNQAALFNWVKGGEKSLSLLTDVIGFADYNNKDLKVTSNNYARIKLGFLKSGDNPVRKNVDLFEISSKVNHKAFGKFDFSAIMLFKTQLAPGYNYSKDPAVLVSKFLNPSILTLGLGLDYKPSKVMSVNFSPFSFKSTYVSDTLNIDQTLYGVQENRKSRNELGANLIFTNEYKPIPNLTLTNKVQLFSSYIQNPLNIDVDWEMIAVFNLNWFTDIRLNTHLIYDDDTKTPVLDNENNPVPGPDGKPKLSARPQFKEMLGFSLVFRF